MNTRDAGRGRATEQPLELVCPICRRRVMVLETELTSATRYCRVCGVHLLRVRARRHVTVHRATSGRRGNDPATRTPAAT